MTLSNLISQLEKSKAFKEFKKTKEGKESFLCAAFIIFNLKQNASESSLDFRSDKDIFTFKIPNEKESGEVILQKEEIIPSRKQLEKIDEKLLASIKIEPEDLQKIIQKALEKNKIPNKLEEIIAVLQLNENKELIWNLTCICDAFTIIPAQIDSTSGQVLKFEKKNLMDFVSIKKPGEKLAEK